MAVVLSLKDWRVRMVRRSHPRLARAPAIGRGTFCRVFESDDSNRVLKLTADQFHVAYLTDGLSPSGVYKPIVFEDFGEVGETSAGEPVYLVEVERLIPLRRGTPNARLARKIITYTDNRETWAADRPQFPEEESQLPGLPGKLYDFMSELNCFADNFGCRIDAHFANFMQRADGTLIFSDPVYDHRMKRESDRRSAA